MYISSLGEAIQGLEKVKRAFKVLVGGKPLNWGKDCFQFYLDIN